jgi:hypothetical protein
MVDDDYPQNVTGDRENPGYLEDFICFALAHLAMDWPVREGIKNRAVQPTTGEERERRWTLELSTESL